MSQGFFTKGSSPLAVLNGGTNVTCIIHNMHSGLFPFQLSIGLKLFCRAGMSYALILNLALVGSLAAFFSVPDDRHCSFSTLFSLKCAFSQEYSFKGLCSYFIFQIMNLIYMGNFSQGRYK